MILEKIDLLEIISKHINASIDPESVVIRHDPFEVQFSVSNPTNILTTHKTIEAPTAYLPQPAPTTIPIVPALDVEGKEKTFTGGSYENPIDVDDLQRRSKAIVQELLANAGAKPSGKV